MLVSLNKALALSETTKQVLCVFLWFHLFPFGHPVAIKTIKTTLAHKAPKTIPDVGGLKSSNEAGDSGAVLDRFHKAKYRDFNEEEGVSRVVEIESSGLVQAHEKKHRKRLLGQQEHVGKNIPNDKP